MAAIDEALAQAYPTPEEREGFWRSPETWQDIGEAARDYEEAMRAYDVGAGSRQNAIARSTKLLDTIKGSLKRRGRS